jgi:hypothetical protein
MKWQIQIKALYNDDLKDALYLTFDTEKDLSIEITSGHVETTVELDLTLELAKTTSSKSE